MRKISFAGIELTFQRVRGYMVPLSYRGDRRPYNIYVYVNRHKYTKQPIMRIEDRLFDRGWVKSAMATRKCGNIYFRKYFMVVRKFTNIFVLLLILIVGSRNTHYTSFASQKKATDQPTLPNVNRQKMSPPIIKHLMGPKSSRILEI